MNSFVEIDRNLIVRTELHMLNSLLMILPVILGSGPDKGYVRWLDRQIMFG